MKIKYKEKYIKLPDNPNMPPYPRFVVEKNATNFDMFMGCLNWGKGNAVDLGDWLDENFTPKEQESIEFIQ